MRKTLGSFILIKNEAQWLVPHLEDWLPILDQMVFFDGNSIDGTLEILESFQRRYPDKLRIYKDKDPKNLEGDYTRLFNECLHSLTTDYAFFLHPDMLAAPGCNRSLGFLDNPKAIVYTSDIESFGGDTMQKVYRFKGGRTPLWHNIFSLAPELGAHYFGDYGALNENVYFEAITGDEHQIDYLKKGNLNIVQSGLKLWHFSDVRPYERRLNRMITCIKAQLKELNVQRTEEAILKLASKHPRVTFKASHDFEIVEFDHIYMDHIKNRMKEYSNANTPA